MFTHIFDNGSYLNGKFAVSQLICEDQYVSKDYSLGISTVGTPYWSISSMISLLNRENLMPILWSSD